MAYNITMVIYTKGGDKGETSLFSRTKKKRRVSKDSLRINAIGTVDEANSFLGVVAAFTASKKLKVEIEEIQRDLLTVGSMIAGSPLRLSTERAIHFEKTIDVLDKNLPVLKNFILPGGGKSGSFLHFARTLVRRSERAIVTLSKKEKLDPEIIIYINRLSDFLFMLARGENHKSGNKEKIWNSKR
jgi:cob(I)alamin adenosyltransferase